MRQLLNVSLAAADLPSRKVCVTILGDRIIDVQSHAQTDVPTRWDLDGFRVAPGFCDLQLNGGFGRHFSDDPEAVWEVGSKLPRFGVTSFLACLVSPSSEFIAGAQDVVRNGPPMGYNGARLLGLHLEGPFLNPEKRGAHNPKALAVPKPETAERWSAAEGIRMVTLAPELPGCLDIIPTLVSRGVVVAAGHSAASYEQALAGIQRGVRYGTHLFNAMGELHHRHPGLAGALLDDERITVGIVADGVHVHPSLIRLAWHRVGKNRLNLVSDAMGALGMAPGRYRHYGLDIVVAGDIARLTDGTLAGSTLPLDTALRNLIAFTGCDLADALATVTTTPAALLGLADRQGAVLPGRIADLVILDRDLRVCCTTVNGEVAFSSPEFAPRMENQ